KGRTDLGQSDFAHQQVERGEGNCEPEQLAWESRRIEWRKHIRVPVTMRLSGRMSIVGRIVTFDRMVEVFLGRRFRFLSVGLRYHLVGIPLNPVIRPKAE